MIHLKGDTPPHLPEFLNDVLAGLRAPRRTLPCKWFYDERGSALFDTICELPEYYLTRTEWGIMERYGAEMGRKLGAGVALVEYGSGSSLKTRLLLRHLVEPAAYVPLDISREHLYRSASTLQMEFPEIPVCPVCADYSTDVILPPMVSQNLVAYFPGSTIGNFAREEARAFLTRAARMVGPGGQLLIGLDLRKPLEVLLPAYNDGAGVTADFNLNLLGRINRELCGSFELENWEHRAIWNDAASRIEMHLISKRAQAVGVQGEVFHFAENETILTEYSHKYSKMAFATLAASGGWSTEKVWTDKDEKFSVQLLRAG